MGGAIFCLLPPLCLVNSAKANYFEKNTFFPGNCIREMKWGVNLGYRKLLARLAQKVESIYVSHSHPLFHHLSSRDMGDNTSEAKSKKPRVVRDIRESFCFSLIFFISGSHCVRVQWCGKRRRRGGRRRGGRKCTPGRDSHEGRSKKGTEFAKFMLRFSPNMLLFIQKSVFLYTYFFRYNIW